MPTNSPKHTPGPWRVGKLADDGYGNMCHDIRTDAGSVARVCVCRPLGSKNPSPKETANARLIAAAPELLAALEACIGALMPIEQSEYGQDNPATRALGKVRAAILAAKGEV